MPAQLATYSFLDVQCTLTGPGGSFPLGSGAGNAEEGIIVRMLEDKNTMMIGADGSAMHSLHAGQSAQIEVTLLKTSPVNNQLSQLYNVQSVNSAIWGQNVLVLTNVNTGDSATGRAVAFKKLPDNSNGKDPRNNVWLFDTGIADQNLATLV